MRYLISLALSILLGLGAYHGISLHRKVVEQKAYKEALAEINKVNYGLFNMNIWKEKALNIFTSKIKEFKISPQVYIDLDAELQQYLHTLYRDYIENGKLVNMFIDDAIKQKKLNKIFAELIRNNAKSMVKEMGLESKIPMLSRAISLELKKNEPKLRRYLQEGLKNIVLEEVGGKIADPREIIYKSFGQTSLLATNDYLKGKIISLEQEISSIVKVVYGLLLFTALLSLLFYRVIGGVWAITFLTLSSIVLLVLGVTMPMIDIDARLNAFSLQIAGSDISFDQQYLYYQSKSILEVTKTLINSRGFDMKIVGVLILLFSIVIPFVKLVLSTLFLFSSKLRDSVLAKGIIYHLGKWSMADVFVVAMFMAYIGFYGVVGNQLDEMSRNESGFAIETLNYSALAPGALFFTTYCILSVITGILIKNWKEKLKYL